MLKSAGLDSPGKYQWHDCLMQNKSPLSARRFLAKARAEQTVDKSEHSDG
ncbi:Uncharacterized protein ChrSV_3347 [Chromobacterium vaccinii]|nr:Uncharacterized protein ChrSW_3347 [Chromobacterium vaccinii]QND90804.1 Uncharacterized protein ChrSV_3347 [Chromobacterium vaccinii]